MGEKTIQESHHTEHKQQVAQCLLGSSPMIPTYCIIERGNIPGSAGKAAGKTGVDAQGEMRDGGCLGGMEAKSTWIVAEDVALNVWT